MSVIHEFNAAHDVAALLEAHGYQPDGKRFKAPDCKHGAGVVLLDDGRVYCHNRGDVLASEHALDPFDVYCALDHGGDFKAAVRDAAKILGMAGDEKQAAAPTAIQPQRTTAAPAKLEWSPLAESIWRKTQSLRGTLGETYLLSRNCTLPPRDSHLRYLPPDGNYPPTLCAGVTDAITGKPLSLHFTRLAADGCGKAGTDQDKLLLKGHRKSGGVVRLWPDECVTQALGLAEGIESALAAAHGFTPVWSAIDAGNMAAFPVLAGIESLTLFIDHDAAGIRAGMACTERWRRRAEVRKVMSEVPGEDFCDVVNAA
jgi:putative DNA primase/helicase